MSVFKDLISQIDPNASAPSAPSPVHRAATGSPKPTPKPIPKPAPRTTTPTNGASSESQTLKRKASGTIESAQVKTLRKDAPAPPRQPNGSAARNPSAPAPVKLSTPASSTAMPYRGTAGLGASKTAPAQVRKPAAPATASSINPRPAAPASRPVTSTTSAAPAKKTGGYMAMLMKAKEKDQTKAVAPPIKHESTKILTKKERLEAKAAAKGKKPAPGPPTKAPTGKSDGKPDGKPDAGKDVRKPAPVGYQGTARPSAPVRKPVAEIGYKGTARPSSTAGGVAGRAGAAAAKRRPNNNEYARWSDDEDEDDMEDEEEDDYGSESDDMEGGLWDMEREEEEALKLAKREDAEALAEENRLKREKEERKRKLMALSKNAAGRKRSQY